MRENVFLILATLLWGFWGWATKFAVERVHPFAVQWMSAIPYVVLIPLWIYLFMKARPGSELFPSGAAIWAISGSVAAVVASLLVYFAMQVRPGSVAIAITSGYPAVTLLLAVLSGQEKITLSRVLGMVLIFSGLVVLEQKSG